MGNSPSVDQAMIALNEIKVQKAKKRSGMKRAPPRRSKSMGKKKSMDCLDKGSNHSRKSAPVDIGNMMDDYDLDDIYAIVKELKRNDQGQKLLDEFVDFQTGKSTRKPRLLDLVDDNSDRSDDEFAIPTEIQFGS
ncbi:expressed unknown protein [Seminavis robusta]|uniref:Uncharacterized protein n=1 Tax=Seminavis robusta TaxID=568900 RepID=A0A9N8DB99_9STRA|nr:expressed unknown protein [Seminavis robusta]|eukprot:Sro42_g025720.1 n/a (135) ;mRNA; r:101825-102229